MKVKHTETLRLVVNGSGVDCIPAIITGDGIRITVDCRERFLDPEPTAKKIINSYNSHDALVEALEECKSILHGIVFRFGNVTSGMGDTISKTEQALKLAGE